MIAFDTWVLADRFRYYGICIYAWRMVAAFQDLAALRGDVIIHPFVATGNSNGVSKFQASSGFEPNARACSTTTASGVAAVLQQRR